MLFRHLSSKKPPFERRLAFLWFFTSGLTPRFKGSNDNNIGGVHAKTFQHFKEYFIPF